MNLLAIFALLLLGGCLLGPKYTPPVNCVSEEWVEEALSDDVTFSKDNPLTDWWNLLEDPLLTHYIEMAACYNNDILRAEALILQARAMRQIAASNLFPQVSADINAVKTYFSKNGPVFAIGPATGSISGTTSSATGLPFSLQIPQIQPLYTALLEVSWEIDLFGKTRRGVEAAEATIGTTIEQRNDILISVIAEIARTYVELRSNQKLSKLLKENIELLDEAAVIVNKQLESGYVNKLDYENIISELSAAHAKLPDVHAQIYRGIYTLSILTGNVPERLVDELLEERPLPELPVEIAVGLKSDLLRRRPDVRAAERQLATATANVGVAVASFFPTITLLGDGGFQSLKIGNLFSWKSRTWALGGDINMPLFTGGNLTGNLKATQAATCAAAYAYQQIVLTALEEAESALAAYSDSVKASNYLFDVEESNRSIALLSRERHEKGLVDLINLINAERNWVASEQNLLQGDTNALINFISLYKALGGGWQPECCD